MIISNIQKLAKPIKIEVNLWEDELIELEKILKKRNELNNVNWNMKEYLKVILQAGIEARIERKY